MGGARFGSWEDAARHPWRTLSLAVVVVVVAGVVSYYDGVLPRSVWVSAAIGIGCGVIVIRAQWRGIYAARKGQPPAGTDRPASVRRVAFGVAGVSVFGVVVGVAGAVIVLWGLVVGNRGLAVSGLPLALLGAILVATRWWLGERDSQESG